MRNINEIIVHCSATREGRDYTVGDITSWHRQRGFNTIGYHYVIYRNGEIHAGRNEDVIGAHCVGHNRNSIGVCYVGGIDENGRKAKDTRTDAQKKSLLQLLKLLKKSTLTQRFTDTEISRQKIVRVLTLRKNTKTFDNINSVK